MKKYSKQNMKLAIGFITYKEITAKYLPYFLPSLFKALAGDIDYKIFCWDNSENDKSNIEFIVSNYPEIKIIKSEKNIGFAAAYNKMIDEAKKLGAEYFLVINPDTILELEAIKNFVEVMEKDKTLGSASPKVLKWDFSEDKKTDIVDTCGIRLKTGLRFIDLGQGEKDRGQYDKTEILGPSGAVGIYRMSALEKITSPLAPLTSPPRPTRFACEGGRATPLPACADRLVRRGDVKYFDELMFMYKEDCDLAYRLNLAGFKAKLAPEAIIYHNRPFSSAKTGFMAFFRGRKGKSEQVKKWSFLNQHIIFLKYWHLQGFLSKIVIILRILAIFVFALLFEPYLLGQYRELSKKWKIIKSKSI